MHGLRNPSPVVAAVMAAVMAATSLPFGAANAGLITTDQLAAELAGKADRAPVQSFLARDDVRRQLRQLGVDPDEAALRVDALSDQELGRINQRLAELPAGQDAGSIIGAIVIVFIVLLITDILGFTKIFPFTRPVRR
jgi:hypothetical protein